MRIYCEINLNNRGSFKPGDPVSGAIKYALDEPTTFNKITVSLRGKGRLHFKKKNTDSDGKEDDTDYYKNEDYVTTRSVITEPGKELNLPVGMYEARFNFELPKTLPPTFSFKHSNVSYEVDCSIVYYVSIKFERPGMFTFNKNFKKEINVCVAILIDPHLPIEPCVLGERKKLTQIFRMKPSIVNLKVTIENSVIEPGGKITMNYELENDTNVDISKVKAKLVESHKFFVHEAFSPEEHLSAVYGTKWRNEGLKRGLSEKGTIEIKVPSSLVGTFEKYSKLVSREYFVHVVVGLPMPHRDVQLKVPVQIGIQRSSNPDSDQTGVQESTGIYPSISDLDSYPDEPPPSYWEAMGEVDVTDKKFGD